MFLVWTGIYIYGVLRIDQVDKALKDAPGMEVSLIQGNIDQSIKWNENFQKETLNIYEELSLESSGQRRLDCLAGNSRSF